MPLPTTTKSGDCEIQSPSLWGSDTGWQRLGAQPLPGTKIKTLQDGWMGTKSVSMAVSLCLLLSQLPLSGDSGTHILGEWETDTSLQAAPIQAVPVNQARTPREDRGIPLGNISWPLASK